MIVKAIQRTSTPAKMPDREFLSFEETKAETGLHGQQKEVCVVIVSNLLLHSYNIADASI